MVLATQNGKGKAQDIGKSAVDEAVELLKGSDPSKANNWNVTNHSLVPAQKELERLVNECISPIIGTSKNVSVVVSIVAPSKARKYCNGWNLGRKRDMWQHVEDLPESVTLKVSSDLLGAPNTMLDLVEYLVHECFHLRAYAEGIKVVNGTDSRQGNIHNENWRALVRPLMDCQKKDETLGHGRNKLNKATRDKVNATFNLKKLEDVFKVYQLAPKLTEKKSKASMIAYACGCTRGYFGATATVDLKCQNSECPDPEFKIAETE